MEYLVSDATGEVGYLSQLTAAAGPTRSEAVEKVVLGQTVVIFTTSYSLGSQISCNNWSVSQDLEIIADLVK